MKRTRTASAKVTPDEQRLLLTRAEALGLTPTNYYRRLLLEAEHSELLSIVLAELCQMRTIQLEFLRASLNGQALTTEFVKAVLENAEATKFAKAKRVLERSTIG